MSVHLSPVLNEKRNIMEISQRVLWDGEVKKKRKESNNESA